MICKILIPILSLLLFPRVSKAGYADQSRSCYTGKSLPFTGYRIENQINLKSWNQEYHLIYCNDNKLAFVAKLSNRPALAALNGLLSSFPVVKIFTSNAVPIMVYREQKRKEEAAKL